MVSKLSEMEIKAINDEYEKRSADEILRYAINKFYPDIAFASSFSAEDVVIIDMIHKINPKTRIFSIDTGRLNPETYDLIDAIREKYSINIEIMFPEASDVEAMVRQHGVNLFYKSIENRRLCCNVRKVRPLNRAIAGLSAWITGLRREQSVTRSDVKPFELDALHGGIVKINPLANWRSDDVWKYIRKNGVPYNKLHDHGYPSIGCAPCTRAVNPGEDERAGRWWWETPEQKECGLHK